MDSEKYIPLTDLIKDLERGVEGLKSGDSSKDSVHELHLMSRELHERLTVLRFKAFEASASKIIELEAENTKSQTNLIDAIKEVSLAEKHQRKPLSSVSEGLTILERANFTSILFSNDDSGFNDMLDDVDGCSGIKEATLTFRTALKPTGRKEDIELAQLTFEDRIPRLFAS
jgi:hypothetical protein